MALRYYFFSNQAKYFAFFSKIHSRNCHFWPYNRFCSKKVPQNHTLYVSSHKLSLYKMWDGLRGLLFRYQVKYFAFFSKIHSSKDHFSAHSKFCSKKVPQNHTLYVSSCTLPLCKRWDGLSKLVFLQSSQMFLIWQQNTLNEVSVLGIQEILLQESPSKSHIVGILMYTITVQNVRWPSRISFCAIKPNISHSRAKCTWWTVSFVHRKDSVHMAFLQQ